MLIFVCNMVKNMQISLRSDTAFQDDYGVGFAQQNAHQLQIWGEITKNKISKRWKTNEFLKQKAATCIWYGMSALRRELTYRKTNYFSKNIHQKYTKKQGEKEIMGKRDCLAQVILSS